MTSNNDGRSSIGSLIADYKYKRNKIPKFHSSYYDITNVIERLEEYKQFNIERKKQRMANEAKQKRRLLKKIKKESFRRAYSIKYPKQYNPYVSAYYQVKRASNIHSSPTVDQITSNNPNSIVNNNVNIYSLPAFRDLPLPRSGNKITAGRAWGGLHRAWEGFRISKSQNNESIMKRYAFAIYRWVHLLELEHVVDFSDIGISLESFENSRKNLKFASSYSVKPS